MHDRLAGWPANQPAGQPAMRLTDWPMSRHSVGTGSSASDMMGQLRCKSDSVLYHGDANVGACADASPHRRPWPQKCDMLLDALYSVV